MTDTAEGEQKAYIHLGPQFAPVSKAAVNEAVKACRARGDAQWLLILGAVFGTARPEQPGCLVGSVKTNIGHLESAAGIAAPMTSSRRASSPLGRASCWASG